MPEGPYFELPLLGPSGGRDIFKWPVQTATNPITYLTWDEWEWSTAYAVVDAVDTRSRMMDAGLDDMRANVVDEYVADPRRPTVSRAAWPLPTVRSTRMPSSTV